jgi:hypothetical protein
LHKINDLLNFVGSLSSVTGTPQSWAGVVPANIFTLGEVWTGIHGARRFCIPSTEYGVYYVVLLIN